MFDESLGQKNVLQIVQPSKSEGKVKSKSQKIDSIIILLILDIGAGAGFEVSLDLTHVQVILFFSIKYMCQIYCVLGI